MHESGPADTATIANAAAYKFVRLDRLPERRVELRRLGDELSLKGTVLLSEEGINLFVAGTSDAIERFLQAIRSQPEFANLVAKISFSHDQPFRRWLVKVKQEIIAFDGGALRPDDFPTPKLSPRAFKQWLDEGRPVTVLDVRNDYEIKLGAFRNATAIGIDSFREFSDGVSSLPEELKDAPVVMYCTGGIRCEKAGPFMKQAGFQDVYQLDGGILKYFEQCGAAHYDGDCFVFDHRVAVDAQLDETEAVLCFACQMPLTVQEQASPYYVPGQSCPNCYQTPEAAMRAVMAQRQDEIDRVRQPLPGRTPYDNRRPMHVTGDRDGATLMEFLTGLHPHVPPGVWREKIEAGRLLRNSRPLTSGDRLRAGERIDHLLPNTVEPDVNAEIRILYEDESVVVINKPAPLPMHPCGRFNKNTLIYLLNQVYRPQSLRVAHRLDANTTGVVVLARTRAVAARIHPQFVQGDVEKVYLAAVRGRPEHDEFSSDAAIGHPATKAGAREVAESGRRSRTNFCVRQVLDDGTTLVEARPRTGRTNQIRLHLAHLGYPIQGDLTYAGGETGGDMQTLGMDDPPLCLHAWKISFAHPESGQRVSFEAPPPSWCDVEIASGTP